MEITTTTNFTWLANVADLPEDSVLVKFFELRQAGTTWKQMPESIKSKVGYHEGSLFEQRQRAIELGECIDLNGERDKMSDTQFGVWVRKQRLAYDGAMDLGSKTGLSWAEIMVRAGLGEGPCRKAFKATANADSKGLRIGHGGRFAEDNAQAYDGKAKRHGWIRPTEGAEALDVELFNRLTEITGDEHAAEIAEMTKPQLVEALKDLGQKATGSKAVLAKRLTLAQMTANA